MNPDFPQGPPSDPYFKLNSGSASLSSTGGFKEPLEYDESANPRAQQNPGNYVGVPVAPYSQFDGLFSGTAQTRASVQLPQHLQNPPQLGQQPQLQHPQFPGQLPLNQQVQPAPLQPQIHGLGQPLGQPMGQSHISQNHHQLNHQLGQLQPHQVQQFPQQIPQHLQHHTPVQHNQISSQSHQPTQHPLQIPQAPPQNQNPREDGERDNKESAHFQEHDVELLKQLLPAGEKHKWKQIAKQINRHNQTNGNGSENNSTSGTGRSGTLSSLELEEDLSNGQVPTSGRKNVSATYVVRQYQHMLGFPKALGSFGELASSLPYAVAEKGWDDVDENEKQLLNDQ
ncbi:hypothetical protein C7M61_004272 [Candidozyma pseudohaemuli]|uniref:Uncharacterized protein n=1 Tax=Candidozyma pseudohaemuli TaxID=418784 RepID=A0A2P7YIJ5_9ASCO|nr:hypothetical protein C7M61_004272 [[Candida] pseudohaemulonii]PSK35790.1 hypothetical protein C7M61_004272 [[Candida] pseudohaemulonii]